MECVRLYMVPGPTPFHLFQYPARLASLLIIRTQLKPAPPTTAGASVCVIPSPQAHIRQIPPPLSPLPLAAESSQVVRPGRLTIVLSEDRLRDVSARET